MCYYYSKIFKTYAYDGNQWNFNGNRWFISYKNLQCFLRTMKIEIPNEIERWD